MKKKTFSEEQIALALRDTESGTHLGDRRPRFRLPYGKRNLLLRVPLLQRLLLGVGPAKVTRKDNPGSV